MRVLLFGANGTIGQCVSQALRERGAEVVAVGRKSGQVQADFEDPASLEKLYKSVGKFNAVVSTAGEVAFAPLEKLGPKEWEQSLGSKLLGQIRLVQLGISYIQDQGSFTLVSGMLDDEPIASGVAASTVNRALEGFVMAAAVELPRGLRVNVVSPGLLKESEVKYRDYFPGFIAVEGKAVAQAFVKSVFGLQTGQTIRVH